MKEYLIRLRIFAVIFVGLIVANSGFTATATSENRYEKDIQAFESSDATNKPPENGILFIGSSSIRLWKDLKSDFPELPVINRGFGGSQISDSVYFAERIVFPYKPRMIIMYAGGNDINAGKSPEEVFNDFKTFVKKVHTNLPSTKIGYIAISPNIARWKQIDKVKEANRLIREYTLRDPRLFFIDTFTYMLGEDGLPKPDIFVSDGLHMNRKGYDIWKTVIRPYLN
ncbi:MAG TPA: SGNH/GDSL hydrolase family protein [Verrucomicrobiota bacterium]|nr:SGNH/GDSL hydrolase family protein [Verrucomicrobiota bacterium]